MEDKYKESKKVFDIKMRYIKPIMKRFNIENTFSNRQCMIDVWDEAQKRLNKQV